MKLKNIPRDILKIIFEYDSDLESKLYRIRISEIQMVLTKNYNDGSDLYEVSRCVNFVQGRKQFLKSSDLTNKIEDVLSEFNDEMNKYNEMKIYNDFLRKLKYMYSYKIKNVCKHTEYYYESEWYGHTHHRSKYCKLCFKDLLIK